MTKRASSDRPAPVSIEAAATRHRIVMAEYLKTAQELAVDYLSASDVGNQSHVELSKAWKDDPTAVFPTMTRLFVKKAHLHVVAALRANKTSNIHSLAAQMRPALECAGQVVSTMQALFDANPKRRSVYRRKANADYYNTMRRLTRGQLDHRELMADIASASSVKNETGRATEGLRVQDSVNSLELGTEWHAHLSECFYHPDLPAITGSSFYGGVGFDEAANGQLAFASLLDYLTEQIVVMIHSATLCPPANNANEQLHGRAATLIEQTVKESERFRNVVNSLASRQDVSR